MSVTGRIEGECIHVTQVNRSVANGVERRTTRTKKKCCSDAKKRDASLPPPKELEFAGALQLDRETLANLELLKRVLKL